jgi:hypothetical protein
MLIKYIQNIVMGACASGNFLGAGLAPQANTVLVGPDFCCKPFPTLR